MMLCTSSSVYYLALNIEWLDIRFKKKKKKKKGKKEKKKELKNKIKSTMYENWLPGF
jgi:hypothetical protein